MNNSWIHVTKKLPAHNEEVLVCDIFGRLEVGHLYVFPTGTTMWSNNWNVKYWMYLPELPKSIRNDIKKVKKGNRCE